MSTFFRFMSQIRIYLTENCNASCPWCFNKDTRDPSKDMDTEKCLKLLDYCAENHIDRLQIMGGEPTMHPDFVKIYNHAFSKFKKVSLFTNGLNKEVLKQIPLANSSGININFNFVDENIDPDLVRQWTPLTTEVVIRKETDVPDLLDKIERVHNAVSKLKGHIMFNLTIDCTLDIFKYKDEIFPKVEGILDWAIAHPEYYWGWDHRYPRCLMPDRLLMQTVELNFKPYDKSLDFYMINFCLGYTTCAGLITADFRLTHCNQYKGNYLPVFNEDGTIIPYNRFRNFLAIESMAKYSSLQNSSCMECKYFMAKCNGGCVGHKFKH